MHKHDLYAEVGNVQNAELELNYGLHSIVQLGYYNEVVSFQGKAVMSHY